MEREDQPGFGFGRGVTPRRVAKADELVPQSLKRGHGIARVAIKDEHRHGGKEGQIRFLS